MSSSGGGGLWGVVGLRNESLPTEMKALLGVAKGTGRWEGLDAPAAPPTLPSCPTFFSVDLA